MYGCPLVAKYENDPFTSVLIGRGDEKNFFPVLEKYTIGVIKDLQGARTVCMKMNTSPEIVQL